MPKEYVVMGATLKCPMGSATSKLMMTPQHRVQSGGKFKASIGDAKPFVNIMPFGTCKSMANPTVAAATAAASGVLQQMPCTPVCSVWIGGKTDFLVDGMPALMTNDKLLCTFGVGMIEIKDSGQGSPPPSPPPPPPPAPGSLSNEEAREWYHEQLDDIPNKIDKSLPLEGQAKQASELRNQIRTDTRTAMKDQDLAKKLFAERPNQPFESYVKKYSAPGRSMDDVYRKIIEKSQQSDPTVDKIFGLIR